MLNQADLSIEEIRQAYNNLNDASFWIILQDDGVVPDISNLSHDELEEYYESATEKES